MLRKMIAPALAATLLLTACESTTTEPTVAQADDYALVMFGEAGAALEGTMGTQPAQPFDGGSAFHRLPERLRLTEEQIAAIRALRQEFRAAHQAEIDSMRTVFQAARAAHEAGATREEVREILLQARAIAIALRPDVEALHQAIWDLLTDAQKAWIRMHHRARHFGPPIARP